MASHSDRRSALLLLAVTLVGLGVRFVLRDAGAPGAILYRPAQSGRGGGARPSDTTSRDSMIARAARLARPLRTGERIDVDKAPVEELARLPRVGPGLAARLAADRDAHGAFGSLVRLGARVPGAGPALLAAIRPFADFSGTDAASDPPGGRITLQPGEHLIVGEGTMVQDTLGARRRGHRGDVGVVSLNAATADQLSGLPGIGPHLAAAIVADRAARGPFTKLEDLARVRGVGPALLHRLQGRLSVP